MIMADQRIAPCPFHPYRRKQARRIDFETIGLIFRHIFCRHRMVDTAIAPEKQAACLDFWRFRAMAENPLSRGS